MVNALKIAPPPPRPAKKPDAVQTAEPEAVAAAPSPAPVLTPEPAQIQEPRPAAPKPATRPAASTKFRQVKEDERVQFNKRVTRRVADGFEMLAIRFRIFDRPRPPSAFAGLNPPPSSSTAMKIFEACSS